MTLFWRAIGNEKNCSSPLLSLLPLSSLFLLLCLINLRLRSLLAPYFRHDDRSQTASKEAAAPLVSSVISQAIVAVVAAPAVDAAAVAITT